MIPTHETPRGAARRLTESKRAEGFRPEALHVYTDRDGAPVYWRIRMKHPESGEKWIRPMKLAEGRYVFGEPEFSVGKPLYRLHTLAERPDLPVIVTEGELKADKLAALGLVVTTSGGADSAEKANWHVLAGRDVLIWPDNDEHGARYGNAVAAILSKLACPVRVVDVSALGLEAKGDAADWLAANPTATAAAVLALPGVPCASVPVADGERDSHGDDEDDEKRQSQASALVAFVVERAILFHDSNSDVYVQDRDTKETRRLEGRSFRDWLVAHFYDLTQKAPRDQAVREALSTLAGLGRYRGECLSVHVRVAKCDGAYFVDLADPGNSKALRIDAGRWEIVTDPPVRFVRPEAQRPLPAPERGGDLSMLWGLINVPDDARLLVIAWLAECLRPDTPFPLLELIGEQGSAKSTTQTILRRLIDPSACDLRASPKAVEDIFVSAGANWLVSYENISHLSTQMQDALCVLATGGGYAKRKLYTDADESVITVKRPVVLNGISAAVTAQDLIDRAVSVETPVIQERIETTHLERTFVAEHGRLLGALLDVVAEALRRLPDVHLAPEDRPRLTEFARLGMAIAEAMGRPAGDFLTEFNASRRESIARTIDASPVASALIEWFEKRGRQSTDISVKTLFEDLGHVKPAGTDAWPRTPKGFADALRRAAPALRQLGIDCHSLGKSGGVVKWRIAVRGKPAKSCPERPASPAQSAAEGDAQDIGTFRTSSTSVDSREPAWEAF